MITLRYQTWRRSFPLGAGAIALCFAGGYYFREERWVWMFEVLFWVVVVGCIAFNLVISLLKKAGLLKFTYTDADRASYLYNMEPLQRQMSENRRNRKRE
jgi:hypothetical protein